MAVRIRMKPMGRKHRPFFRIVAMDSRTQRNGRALEQLGTYDPMIPKTDDRVTLKPERIKYWLSVGAQPSEKVGVLLRKYMEKWEKIEADRAAGIEPTPEPTEESSEAAAPKAEAVATEESASEEEKTEESE